MFNLELKLEELHELHVTLTLRKFHLTAEVTHPNQDIANIALRQLERVSPLLYYVESIVKEHHEQSFRKDIEDSTEAVVEREMDRLDKKLMQGHITQEDYDSRVVELDNWSKSKLASI